MSFLVSRKAVALIALAGVLPVLMIIIGASMAQSSAAKTVRLSTGKSVAIGQSVASLKSTLAGNITEVRPGIFRYPANIKKPAQIDIYTNNNEVVGMLIGRNKKHFQVLNKAHLGMTGTALSRLFGGRLQAVDTTQDFVKQRGYKVGGLGAVSYYLTQTCTAGLGDNIRNGDNVVYLAIVKPGQEKAMKFLNKPLECVPPPKAVVPATSNVTTKK